MITPYLEKLIHEGRAVWKNEVLGLSQAFSIKIPENCYIVITDFSYSNFVEVGGNLVSIAGISWADILQRSVHQCRFKSETSLHNYIIKQNINVSQDFRTMDYQWFCNGDTKFDCYQFHEKNLKIELCVCFTVPMQFQITQKIQQTNFDSQPNGVGTVTNGGLFLIDSMVSGPMFQLVFDDFTAFFGGPAVQGFRRLNFPFNNTTQFITFIADFVEVIRNNAIINISYVQINERLQSNIITR